MPVTTVDKSIKPIASSGYKIVGQRRELFFRDIASGMKYKDIAMSYGCSLSYVNEAVRTHKEYIAELKEELGEELNTVYLADKMERLRERAKSYSMIVEHQRKLEEEAQELEGGMAVSEQWLKYEQVKQQILRAIDEALGGLTTRSTPTQDHNPKLYHTIEGVPDLVKAMGLTQK